MEIIKALPYVIVGLLIFGVISIFILDIVYKTKIGTAFCKDFLLILVRAVFAGFPLIRIPAEALVISTCEYIVPI